MPTVRGTSQEGLFYGIDGTDGINGKFPSSEALPSPPSSEALPFIPAPANLNQREINFLLEGLQMWPRHEIGLEGTYFGVFPFQPND